MKLKHPFPRQCVGQADQDGPRQPSAACQGGVENVWAVCRADHQDFPATAEAVDFGEQLVQKPVGPPSAQYAAG
jgi:hypothetical protein